MVAVWVMVCRGNGFETRKTFVRKLLQIFLEVESRGLGHFIF